MVHHQVAASSVVVVVGVKHYFKVKALAIFSL